MAMSGAQTDQVGLSGAHAGRDVDPPPAEARPLRVLFVIGTLDIGGAERQLVELVSGLDRNRFAPTVCCLSGPGPLAEILARAGVPTLAVGFFTGRSRARAASGHSGVRRAAVRVAGSVAAAFSVPVRLLRFLRIVRNARPDVVHGLLFHAYTLGAVAAVLMRVPVVVASRRSLSHFKAHRPHYRSIEQLANRWTDLVIANSEAVRRDALDSEALPPERVIVIHNGVDLDAFGHQNQESVRRELDLGSGPVVLVVANLLPYKGHRFFFDAWSRVCAEYADACALIAGDGPERAVLEKQVRALHLTENVRFLGTRRDVARLLSAADLLAHPSLEEGFSNAILEAMASGRPVVATDVGGGPEAVVTGQTGWLVPPRNSHALAEAMLRVLGTDDRGRAMGTAGRARIAERFQRQTMIERYESTYLSLVRGRLLAAR